MDEGRAARPGMGQEFDSDPNRQINAFHRTWEATARRLPAGPESSVRL